MSRPDATSFMASAWDPAAEVGWWGRLDPSPILNFFNGEWSNARNLWGLGALIALVLAAALYLVRLAGNLKGHSRFIIALLLAFILCWAMALGSPFLLPSPQRYAGSDLGPLPLPVPSRALTVDGPGHEGALLSGPHLAVLSGRYRVSVDYTVEGPLAPPSDLRGSGDWRPWTEFYGGPVLLPSAPRTSNRSFEFNVKGPGHLSVNLTWRGTGLLTVKSVVIAKVATCHVVGCQGGCCRFSRALVLFHSRR